MDATRPAARGDRMAYAGAKRLLDASCAGLGLLLLFPLTLVIAIGIRWGSPGPVLFRQVRVGRSGRRFTLFKFRTMRVGAKADAEGKVHVDRPVATDDPAITPFGRRMRQLGLDEIPQLLNVLRGDMSLVGPRPTIPEQVEAYTAWERRRLDVPQGITGLAQISGRNNLPWPERIKLDIEYVESCSLAEDLRILVLTVRRVFVERSLDDR
jgi:lipopolysaccharide/colanic/teichoic acid biosynthesis glycosyltransferase